MFTPTNKSSSLPTALEIATFAVTLLEDDPLFNAGKGAVYTRDGIQQLEASVMVSRGFAKRAAGVLGLRHIKNPIQLAAKILEHGEEDLWGSHKGQPSSSVREESGKISAPSAQGHTLLYGDVAEQLATEEYGMALVPTSYFFTQTRWDEHIRALEREKQGTQRLATWSAEEYLPQGTTGAVALDSQGTVCCATSTGGLTNKLTGRIGDTPVPGAGYWAEEWTEKGDPTSATQRGFWEQGMQMVRRPGTAAAVEFTGALQGLLADCLPTPFVYSPVVPSSSSTTTTRSFATSGTGNGDSFLRVNAGRTAAAIARWKPVSSATALTEVTGPGGELQKSAGDRWMVTGEGEGGMIGVEAVVVRDDKTGCVVETRSEILQDHNCPGMFRAWVDDDDHAVFQVWHDKAELAGFEGEGRREPLRGLLAGEKTIL